MKPHAELRREWFSVSAHALAHTARCMVDDSIGETFVACPLCWRFFDESALFDLHGLTVEHVPPRSLGGKPLVLTCSRCNNTAGSRVDAAAQKRLKFRSALAGGGGVIDVQISGVDTQLTIDQERSLLLVTDPARSASTARKALLDQMNALAAAGRAGGVVEGPSITMSIRIPYSGTRAALSWVRSAYLLIFAHYGYQAVLADVYRPVRRMMRDLDPNVVPLMPVVSTGADEHGFWAALHPVLGQVLCVMFGDTAVLLPNPMVPDPGWWDRVDHAALSATFIDATPLPWPMGPEHRWDLQQPVAAPDACVVVDLFGDRPTGGGVLATRGT